MPKAHPMQDRWGSVEARHPRRPGEQYPTSGAFRVDNAPFVEADLPTGDSGWAVLLSLILFALVVGAIVLLLL